jgi:hypothetical protein
MRELEHVFSIEMDALTQRIDRGDVAHAAMIMMQSKHKGNASPSSKL